MTDAVKLLTEAEWKDLLHESGCVIAAPVVLAKISERGLIEPEPEPQPLVEVELAKVLAESVFQYEGNRAPYSNGFRDGFLRGMEMRAPLTREMVREAVRNAASRVHVGPDGYADFLHAALTKEQS